MDPRVQEAVFAIALVGGLIWAYKTIPQGLQDVKDAARSPDPNETTSPSKGIAWDAEDKINVDTLDVLSSGHSFELRNAAIKIVSARAVNYENRKLLLLHLGSSSASHRDNAISAVRLLFFGSKGPEYVRRDSLYARFQDEDAFYAIISALVNILPEHKTSYDDSDTLTSNHPPSPIQPLRRPAQEVTLLSILLTAIRGHDRSYHTPKSPPALDVALDAGLVTLWLAKYPFPCTLPQFSKLNYKRSDVCGLFDSARYATDDMTMHEIIRLISFSSRGSNQLRAAGLKAFRITENLERSIPAVGRRRRAATDASDTSRLDFLYPPSLSNPGSPIDIDDDTRMIGGEDTAGQPTIPTNWTPVDSLPRYASDEWFDEPHPRLLERSREEVSLRRRNREAVVVAERGQPLGRENILRRQTGDSERAMPLPPEGMRAMRRSSGRQVMGIMFTADGEEYPMRSESPDGMPDLEPLSTTSSMLDPVRATGELMPDLPESSRIFRRDSLTSVEMEDLARLPGSGPMGVLGRREREVREAEDLDVEAYAASTRSQVRRIMERGERREGGE
jgi:hypothetical protein